jgi:hypothetical protein
LCQTIQVNPNHSKPFQGKPRKKEEIPRQKDLDSLGFLRAIRGLSMRYSEFPRKIFFARSNPCLLASPLRPLVLVTAGVRSFYPAKDNTISDLL